MARYLATVSSTRSPSEVFGYMADFANAAKWDPGVLGARREDAGPVSKDSSFLLDVKIGRRVVPIDYRIVTYQPPQKVALLGETSTIKSFDTISVSASGDGGTVLTYEAVLTLKGLFAVLNPVLGAAFRRIGDRAIAGLRRELAA